MSKIESEAGVWFCDDIFITADILRCDAFYGNQTSIYRTKYHLKRFLLADIKNLNRRQQLRHIFVLSHENKRQMKDQGTFTELKNQEKLFAAKLRKQTKIDRWFG